MRPDIVGYRYSRRELTALMRLMNIESLPGFEPDAMNTAEYHEAIASLVTAGLATRAEDTVYVDRITALILSAMHRRSGEISIQAQNRGAVLIRSDIMLVLAEYPSRGSCILTPLELPEDAMEPTLAALERCSYPVILAFQSGGNPVSSEQAASAEAAQSRLTDLIGALCAEASTER